MRPRGVWGELRIETSEPGVEQCGEVVERLRERTVRAQDGVVPGGDLVDEAALHGLQADNVRVGIGDAAWLIHSAARSLEPDGHGREAFDDGRAGREAAEGGQEGLAIGDAPEGRIHSTPPAASSSRRASRPSSS
jgi:hypothetical protein